MHLLIFKSIFQRLIITALVCIVLANNASSQQTKHVNQKFGFGLNMSTDLCYRWLSNNDKSATSQMLIESRNMSESTRVGYTLGMVGQLELKPSRMFEVGLQYSKMGFSTSDIFFDNNNIKGFVQPSPLPISNKPIKRFSIINDFTYLELPVSIILEKQYASYSIFTRFGIVPGYLIGSTVYEKFVFTDGSRDKTTAVKSFNTFNSINLSSIVSFGTAYELRNQFKIRVETNFKYGLLRIINAPVTGRLWSSGINVSCIKSF